MDRAKFSRSKIYIIINSRDYVAVNSKTFLHICWILLLAEAGNVFFPKHFLHAGVVIAQYFARFFCTLVGGSSLACTNLAFFAQYWCTIVVIALNLCTTLLHTCKLLLTWRRLDLHYIVALISILCTIFAHLIFFTLARGRL